MATPTAQQFLTALRTYLGVTESPLGSNRTRVGVEFGWNGVAWCAMTQSVAARKAGFEQRFWSASTDQWEAWAKTGRNGARWMARTITPIPGDICVWDWKGDGTANHVSAIESVRADGRFVTIGGNENHRCQRAVRSRSGLRGFVRMPFRIPTAATHPILRRGSTGPAVGELQRKLNIATGSKLVVSSPPAYGPKTEAVVVAFKKYMGLSPADDIVGPRTWAVLDYIVASKT